jgi:hypothetical protein
MHGSLPIFSAPPVGGLLNEFLWNVAGKGHGFGSLWQQEDNAGAIVQMALRRTATGRSVPETKPLVSGPEESYKDQRSGRHRVQWSTDLAGATGADLRGHDRASPCSPPRHQ